MWERIIMCFTSSCANIKKLFTTQPVVESHTSLYQFSLVRFHNLFNWCPYEARNQAQSYKYHINRQCRSIEVVVEVRKQLIPTSCSFLAIRLCSDRQNTSLYHRTKARKQRLTLIYSTIWKSDKLLTQLNIKICIISSLVMNISLTVLNKCNAIRRYWTWLSVHVNISKEVSTDRDRELPSH